MEIIAAVIGAVVTGFIGLGIFLYRQHRGNWVIVERLSQTPQIKFSDAVQKKLEIIYNGRKVDNLVLTQFVIFNKSDKNIKPLKLTVNVTPKSDNFTYAELNVSDPQEITISKMDSGTGAFEIERPYLKSQKKYKEEKIEVSLFSDVLLDFSVNGGGEDWGCKVVNSATVKKWNSKIFLIAGAFMIGVLLDVVTNSLYAYLVLSPEDIRTMEYITNMIIIMVVLGGALSFAYVFAKK